MVVLLCQMHGLTETCLINFLVSSHTETMFVKFINGYEFVMTREKLFEMFYSLVEEIGEENAVQVITNDGSNYVLVGKLLEEEKPHLYWTPCVCPLYGFDA